MSAHTPGRLVAAPCTDNPGANLVHEHVSGELRFIAHVSIPADARRLAACWNACEGLSTEQIEELVSAGGAAGSLVCIDELRANYQKKINEVFGMSSELVAARALLAEVLTSEEASLRQRGLGLAQHDRIQRIRSFLKAPK